MCGRRWVAQRCAVLGVCSRACACAVASRSNLRVVNGYLNLNARLDTDGRDLLDNLGGGVQVDQALVDAHFEAVVGVGSLTARRFARGDAQLLGR